jgi:hypothetical protein
MKDHVSVSRLPHLPLCPSCPHHRLPVIFTGRINAHARVQRGNQRSTSQERAGMVLSILPFLRTTGPTIMGISETCLVCVHVDYQVPYSEHVLQDIPSKVMDGRESRRPSSAGWNCEEGNQQPERYRKCNRLDNGRLLAALGVRQNFLAGAGAVIAAYLPSNILKEL